MFERVRLRSGSRTLIFRLSVAFGFLLVATGCGGTATEEEASPEETTVETTMIVEETVFRTVQEEAVVEEDDAVVGEDLDLGGLVFTAFSVRSDPDFYYYPSPDSSAQSETSTSGEYVFVDYLAQNTGDAGLEVNPTAEIEDASGDTYEAEDSSEIPTDGSAGRTLEPDSRLSSTLVFDVPSDFDPETLRVSYGDEEAVVNLGERDISEVSPEEYMSIYHLWFNEREYDEIYSLFDPGSTQGISEGEWEAYFDSIWGNWFLSLDGVSEISEDSSNAAVEVGRSFYGSNGSLTSDSRVQEMVRDGEGWKLLLRDDQASDIINAPGYTPEEGGESDEEGVEGEVEEEPAAEEESAESEGSEEGFFGGLFEEDSPEPVVEPDPIVLSGTGPTATEPIQLESGLAVVNMTHQGSSNFIVDLLDSEGSALGALGMANVIGSFQGSTAAQVPEAGEYTFDIDADGPWEIVVEQPRRTEAPATTSFSGSGQQTTELFQLDGGLHTFQMTHQGEGNFIVDLLDEEGYSASAMGLANDIGPYDGSTAETAPDDGIYVLSVQADGPWTINIE